MLNHYIQLSLNHVEDLSSADSFVNIVENDRIMTTKKRNNLTYSGAKRITIIR